LFLRDEELVALLDAEGVVPGIDMWQGCIDTVLDGGDTVERACRRTKLLKKVVKNNGFWRINAIRPVIKARRGRMRKFK